MLNKKLFKINKKTNFQKEIFGQILVFLKSQEFLFNSETFGYYQLYNNIMYIVVILIEGQF